MSELFDKKNGIERNRELEERFVLFLGDMLSVDSHTRAFAAVQAPLFAEFQVACHEHKIASHMINDACSHPFNALALKEFIRTEQGTPCSSEHAPTQGDAALARFGELVIAQIKERIDHPNGQEVPGFPPPLFKRDLSLIIDGLNKRVIEPIDVPRVLSTAGEYRALLRGLTLADIEPGN